MHQTQGKAEAVVRGPGQAQAKAQTHLAGKCREEDDCVGQLMHLRLGQSYCSPRPKMTKGELFQGTLLSLRGTGTPARNQYCHADGRFEDSTTQTFFFFFATFMVFRPLKKVLLL